MGPATRAALRATAVALVLGASAACAAAHAPGPAAAAAAPAATGTLVMVIRHGEKPAGAQKGVDANGRPDSHALTSTGWDRAHRLADLFAPVGGAPRTGLARPAAVYAATANDLGDGLRTRETVTPLADRLGVRVNTDFGKGQEQALVARVAGERGPVLVSWQHEEIPAIAAAFPSVTPAPPAQWPDNRYDVVWTFTKTAGGWSFAQLPELVLPGDGTSVITG